MKLAENDDMELIRSNCFGLTISRLDLIVDKNGFIDGFLLKNLKNIFPNLVVLQISGCERDGKKPVVRLQEKYLVEILKNLSEIRRLTIENVHITTSIKELRVFEHF